MRCSAIIQHDGGFVQCQLVEHDDTRGHYHEFNDQMALGWDAPVHPRLADLNPGQVCLIRMPVADE